MMALVDAYTRALRAALALLGVDRLAFSIHDASFPSTEEEETGRGTPYGRGAGRLLEGVAAMGFDAVQLGPQGLTDPGNPSPYDGAAFARSVDSIALAPMRDAGWISEGAGELPADRTRADHRRSRRIVERALEAAEPAAGRELAGAVAEARAVEGGWLERDALFEVLCAVHGTRDVGGWPELDRGLWADDASAHLERRRQLVAEHGAAIDRFALYQVIAERQHEALRARCRELGLALAGDLPIGMATRDRWSYQAVLWPDYDMGAPPSRTNPDGQAWGYPILDPAQCGEGGAGRAFVRARLERVMRAYDLVRVDHPHGWICPWVYRTDAADPAVAVREGARMWSSPDLPDHPALAPLARVRPDQIDHALPRHHDHRVRALEPAQIEAYGALFQLIVDAAGDTRRLICEVLSTQPRPLAAVLARHGLGRFRVTQKANLADPADVYRAENAEPADWIMVGNHDTASIWQLVRTWRPDELAAQARHLSARLSPPGGRPLAEWLAGAPERVALAKLAELFTSRARHVLIFFADLFGIEERYNAPGTVGAHNWALRVAPDWADRYPVLMPQVLGLALRARGGDDAEALAARLDARLP